MPDTAKKDFKKVGKSSNPGNKVTLGDGVVSKSTEHNQTWKNELQYCMDIQSIY